MAEYNHHNLVDFMPGPISGFLLKISVLRKLLICSIIKLPIFGFQFLSFLSLHRFNLKLIYYYNIPLKTKLRPVTTLRPNFYFKVGSLLKGLNINLQKNRNRFKRRKGYIFGK